MRKRFEQQLSLGTTPICDVKIPQRSRDELPPVLAGLKHIYCDPEINSEIFAILEAKVCHGKKKTGRPGMSLWEILVLGTVRLCLDTNWDRLEHLANYDALIRGILGVLPTDFSQGKEYKIQTLRDNVALLDEATLLRINEVVVRAGHRIVKKKEDQDLAVKVDSYVLETNVHYPTDLNLLWDSGRKCIDLLGQAQGKGWVKGWRKHREWARKLKKKFRTASRVSARGGPNRKERLKDAVGAYLGLAGVLAQKVKSGIAELEQQGDDLLVIATLVALYYYRDMLLKHIELVERRLIKGEKIPHEEKVFSIFEPHSEWISKGKQGKTAEIGHKVLVATDQYNFILHHRVVEKVSDYNLAVPVGEKLCAQHSSIRSISFDRGFFSKTNKEALQKMIPMVVMPKKGKLSVSEKEEESNPEFKRLKNQHSAVESNINQLECNGLNRCPDKGMHGFKRYTALGVLAYNLHHLGSEILKAERKKESRKKKRGKAAA